MVAGEQAHALVQHVDCFAGRVLVVLLGEVREVLQVVVGETTFEGYGAPTPYDDVLIHPALLDASLASSPDTEHAQRVAAAVSNPSPHENVLAVQVDANHIGGKAGKFPTDLLGKIRFDHLVRVQTHNPVGPDRGIVQRPLELLGLGHERMYQHRGAVRTGDLRRCVGRAGIDYEDFGGDLADRIQRTRKVQFLVVGEDDDGKAHGDTVPVCMWRTSSNERLGDAATRSGSSTVFPNAIIMISCIPSGMPPATLNLSSTALVTARFRGQAPNPSAWHERRMHMENSAPST